MGKLNSCYCGGKAELKFDEALNSWYVQCVDCCNTYPGVKIGVKYQEAIREWNRLADYERKRD